MTTRKQSILIIIFMHICFTSIADDIPTIIQSGDEAIPLIELYTSEGCSSCPSAEKWFSRLKDDPRLWKQFVPVAFHVDYWNYIGWTDPFASPVYTSRQKHYAAVWKNSRIYTPEFVISGKEWRGWFKQKDLDLGRRKNVGQLRLELTGNNVDILFLPAYSHEVELDVHLVVLGFGVSSNIVAGENNGRRLIHDFIALGYHREKFPDRQDSFRLVTKLPVAKMDIKKRGVAAWISTAGDPQPIQAVGGFLD